MRNTIGYQLYAYGQKKLPRTILFDNNTYILSKILKHDFFAATAVYQLARRKKRTDKKTLFKIVLKIYRRQHFLGLPMTWLGKSLRNHEIENLRRLRGISQVPKVLSIFGKTGFIYKYIVGCSLYESKNLPDDFFDRLLELVNRMHSFGIACLDLNKRSNIVVGEDGRPFLIDFQIALYMNKNPIFGKILTRYIWNCFRKADIYHLFKHKRKLKPQLLSQEERNISHSKTKFIALHRLLTRPLKNLRRCLLRYLYSKNILPIDAGIGYSDEDNPSRFLQ
jgi:predicted Ser/Thr protein kinase